MPNIAQTRLSHQHITEQFFSNPADLVSYMGALQAQDYEMGKWGIGLRLKNCNEEIVEAALNRGEIIRTHMLRPTWHFVSSENVRWMTELSAPQLQRASNSYNKQLGIDEKTLKKATVIIGRILQGNHLTREEIMKELNAAKINTDSFHTSHIMLHAEISGLVVSGVKKGKKQTYSLTDERVPFAKSIPREEAIIKLIRIFFTSHAPATLKDFSWWSGLNLTDIKKGIASIQSELNSIQVGENLYYFMQSDIKKMPENKGIHVLPAFDEYLVSYANRRDALHEKHNREIITVNGIFKPVIVSEGQVIGQWKRTNKPKHIEIGISLFEKKPKQKMTEIQKRFRAYGEYLNTADLKFV